jgi:small subunit ribosomal protein S1
MAQDTDRPWPPVPPPGRPAPSAARPRSAAARPEPTGPYASGEIVSGPATSVRATEIEVDLGDGHVGVLTDRHYAENLRVDLTGEAKVGDTIEGAVLLRDDRKGRIVMSRVWAMQQRAWDNLETARDSGEKVTALVVDSVKGGLSVNVGVRGFVPGSLIDVGDASDPEELVGKTIECKVVEVDRIKGRLILSRKAALRSGARQSQRAALEALSVGDIKTGKVEELAEFGAFVNVDGIRGLVHRSELSWSRPREPSDVVNVGDEVEVRVLKIQPAKLRLGLSMKQGTDPLKQIKVGARHSGPVTRLVDFGAFVEVAPGVEGLVHLSELSEYRVRHAEEVVMIGEDVTVKVIGVDRKRRTVDLSVTQAVLPDLPAPDSDASSEETQ